MSRHKVKFLKELLIAHSENFNISIPINTPYSSTIRISCQPMNNIIISAHNLSPSFQPFCKILHTKHIIIPIPLRPNHCCLNIRFSVFLNTLIKNFQTVNVTVNLAGLHLPFSQYIDILPLFIEPNQK